MLDIIQFLVCLQAMYKVAPSCVLAAFKAHPLVSMILWTLDKSCGFFWLFYHLPGKTSVEKQQVQTNPKL